MDAPCHGFECDLSVDRHTEGVHSEDERALTGGYVSISNEAIDWPLNPAKSCCVRQIFFFFVSPDLAGTGCGS